MASTSQTTAQLNTEINTNLASNQNPPITAVQLRQVLSDMAVSYPNVYSIDGFAGIDTTGATDSAAGLQSAINAIPDSSVLFFPAGSTLHLGSTVTITDRVGLTLMSNINQNDSSGAPQFVWIGANNGLMFDIQHCDHPRFSGFRFISDGVHTVDTFLNFDGVPGGNHIGTLAEVDHCDFYGSGQNNANFVAISISKVARTNHENSYIHDNNITGDGGQLSVVRAIDGVATSGSTTLTSATANFTVADIGKRIRISYPGTQGGLFLDTTIASRNSNTSIVLTAAPTWIAGYIGSSPLSGVQITIGTNYGIGIFQGNSQNAKHSRFYSNRITGCDIAIKVAGGSADIRHLGGGFGGTGVFISDSVIDAIIVEQVEMEGNLREIEVKGSVAPVTIIGSRVANANQLSDGFYKLGGAVTLIGSASVSSFTGTTLGANNNVHAVVVGEQGTATSGATGSPLILVSMNNQFGISTVQSGYPLLFYGYLSLNDNIGNNPNATTVFSGGNASGGQLLQLYMLGLPTSAPGSLGSGQVWSNSGVMTIR